MGHFDYPGSNSSKALVENSDGVLDNLSDRDWRRLIDFSERCNFDKGDIVVRSGERDDSVYILVEGEVEVVFQRKFLSDKTLAVIPTGSVFGEMAFFDQKPRSATIRAISKGLAVKIKRHDFDKLFEREPDIAQKLLIGFGKVLSLRNRKMATLSSS